MTETQYEAENPFDPQGDGATPEDCSVDLERLRESVDLFLRHLLLPIATPKGHYEFNDGVVQVSLNWTLSPESAIRVTLRVLLLRGAWTMAPGTGRRLTWPLCERLEELVRDAYTLAPETAVCHFADSFKAAVIWDMEAGE